MTYLPTRARHTGFTLIEIAVAVFIMALLLGSVLIPLTVQVEQRQISDVQKTLDEIKEAIIGFAAARGYIPCPDKTTSGGVGTMNDGEEDVSGSSCVVLEGNLPWVTLGVANSDPWGNRFRYRVFGTFAQRSPTAITLSTLVTTVEVCSVTSCAIGYRLTTSGDGPPAVILSHGKNGYGAISSASTTLTTVTVPCPTPSCSTDEQENIDGDTTYIYRTHSGVGALAGEFDDIAVWISRNILLNRMIAAGKLP